jgi:hypothetical protein
MATPLQSNQVSFTLTEREKAEIDEALTRIESIIGPKMVALTPEGRQELPKMGRSTTAFVEKALEYARAHPPLVPAYLPLDELQTDLDGAMLLSEYLRRLGVLTSGISDTAMLSGSEAYMTALVFYNSVRLASKNNIPGAEAIYSDLAERFPGRPAR